MGVYVMAHVCGGWSEDSLQVLSSHYYMGRNSGSNSSLSLAASTFPEPSHRPAPLVFNLKLYLGEIFTAMSKLISQNYEGIPLSPSVPCYHSDSWLSTGNLLPQSLKVCRILQVPGIHSMFPGF